MSVRVQINPTPADPSFSILTVRSRASLENLARVLSIGSKVVPFSGFYLESYKETPKRNYFGAYGYRLIPYPDFGNLVVQLRPVL